MTLAEEADIRAQLVAAQARAERLFRYRSEEADAATERAEKAESRADFMERGMESFHAQRDAAIKAKEEAERELADEEAESTHLNQLWQAARAETKAAQAMAEALRAALVEIRDWRTYQGEGSRLCPLEIQLICDEALAAHSKAVAP